MDYLEWRNIGLAWAILLALLALVQGILVFGMVFSLRRFRRKALLDDECPKAAVVLCLRGADPFLEKVLRAVLTQDYPDYLTKIIIDHRQDPTWDLVHNIIGRFDQTAVSVEVLENIRTTCSLKCSSLIQAIAPLDESYGVVAQLDADTVPHKTWLRELVAPLRDERVGVVTGNRWYMPAHPTTGSMVRYLWNACAIVQMFWYQIAWGGTLAIKTSVIRKCGLLEEWGKAFCEDTLLYEFLKREKLRAVFVPSLIMVNREQCDLGGFFHWMTRQLLTAKLHHPKFSSVVAHGVLVTLVSAGTLAFIVAAFVWQQPALGIALAVAWGIYELALTLFILPMEVAVRKIASSRGEATHWIRPKTLITGLWGVLVLQVVYPAALFRSLTVQIVDWRGVRYRVGRGSTLELLEYRPFVPLKQANPGTSL